MFDVGLSILGLHPMDSEVVAVGCLQLQSDSIFEDNGLCIYPEPSTVALGYVFMMPMEMGFVMNSRFLDVHSSLPVIRPCG